MAMYDYTCDECGKVSEHLVMSMDDEVVCPSCGSKKMTRMLSACSFAVKGGSSSGPSGGGYPCCGCNHRH